MKIFENVFKNFQNAFTIFSSNFYHNMKVRMQKELKFMTKYIVSGRVNSKYISEKEFKTNDKALQYIDKLCSRYDLQVEEIINQDLEMTYVVDYYNQFSIKQLAI